MIGEKKITPTLTLAQLYDAQKQYFDAFTIYNQLYQLNPNEDLKARLDSAEKKIFSDTNLLYNDIINKIFTDEDKVKFKILPNENYENFRQIMLDFDNNEVVFQEEDFEENEYDMSDAEEIEEEFIFNDEDNDEKDPIIKPNEQVSDANQLSIEYDIMNLSISQLSDFIIQKLKKDKKISEITLKEYKLLKKMFQDLL